MSDCSNNGDPPKRLTKFGWLSAVTGRHLAAMGALETKAALCIFDHADGATLETHVSMQRIAREIGVTNVGRARAAVQRLTTRGLVTTIATGGGRSNSTVRRLSLPEPQNRDDYRPSLEDGNGDGERTGLNRDGRRVETGTVGAENGDGSRHETGTVGAHKQGRSASPHQSIIRVDQKNNHTNNNISGPVVGVVGLDSVEEKEGHTPPGGTSSPKGARSPEEEVAYEALADCGILEPTRSTLIAEIPSLSADAVRRIYRDMPGDTGTGLFVNAIRADGAKVSADIATEKRKTEWAYRARVEFITTCAEMYRADEGRYRRYAEALSEHRRTTDKPPVDIVPIGRKSLHEDLGWPSSWADDATAAVDEQTRLEACTVLVAHRCRKHLAFILLPIDKEIGDPPALPTLPRLDDDSDLPEEDTFSKPDPETGHVTRYPGKATLRELGLTPAADEETPRGPMTARRAEIERFNKNIDNFFRRKPTAEERGEFPEPRRRLPEVGEKHPATIQENLRL